MGKILIIEDDPDIRLGIRVLLEGEGYQVEETGTGQEGLSRVTGDTE